MNLSEIATYKLYGLLLVILCSIFLITKRFLFISLGRLDIKAAQFTLFDNKPQIFQQLTKIVKYPISLQSTSAGLGGSKVMQFDLSANFL